MNRAQRIKLLTEAAQALADRQWAEMDLILREFGCPTAYDWQEGVLDYALAMLREIDDVALIELHEMLIGRSDVAAMGSAGPWEEGFVRVFMSHIHAERGFVGGVKRELRRYGIDAFVAHDDIEPSQAWMTQIKIALGTCDALAAFLHPGFRESQWCDQEVGFCLPRGVLIMPLMFGPDPHGFLGQWQGDKCQGSTPGEVARRIFNTCSADERVRPKLAEGLLTAFENAGSYNEAYDLVNALEDFPDWTSAQVKRMRDAYKNNDQIHGSVKAGPRARALLNRLTPPVPFAPLNPDDVPF